MDFKQIKDIERVDDGASKEDVILIEQKQEDGTYKSRSATIEQVATSIKDLVGSDEGGEDVLNLGDYITLPMIDADIYCADITNRTNELSLQMDATLYSKKDENLADIYIKYPGRKNYQQTLWKFIPKNANCYYLNLPKGTVIYSRTNDADKSNSNTYYLKIYDTFNNCTENVNNLTLTLTTVDNTLTLKTEIIPCSNIPNVSYYAQLSTNGNISYIYFYVRNDSKSTIYPYISNKYISQCQYYMRYAKTDTNHTDPEYYGNAKVNEDTGEIDYTFIKRTITKKNQKKPIKPGESKEIGRILSQSKPDKLKKGKQWDGKMFYKFKYDLQIKVVSLDLIRQEV